MTRAKSKPTTPKRAAEPLTEASDRILKAVDVTRLLFEHIAENKDATQIGRRNRDRGFGILLVHLKRAYEALYRYSNRKAVAGAPDPIFAAMAACERVWAAFDAIAGEEDKIDARLRPIEDRLGIKFATRHPTFEAGIGSQRFEHEGQIRQFFAAERKKSRPVAITTAQWWTMCRKAQAKALSRFRKAQREVKRFAGQIRVDSLREPLRGRLQRNRCRDVEGRSHDAHNARRLGRPGRVGIETL